MKFIKPGENRVAVPESYSGRPPAAVKAIIERSRSRYIKLECGHLTDWDTDVFYGHLDPLGPLTHWCEKCDAWIRKVEVKPTPLPDEPLF